MLNRDDRRRLNAIEQQLRASDPDLAHLLTHWPMRPRHRWARAGAVFAIVLGMLGVVAGLITFSPTLVLVFGAMAVAGWVGVLHCRRRCNPRPGG
jgi:ferric-dicitrate binding protein FerR (iron transport regulator)